MSEMCMKVLSFLNNSLPSLNNKEIFDIFDLIDKKGSAFKFCIL